LTHSLTDRARAVIVAPSRSSIRVAPSAAAAFASSSSLYAPAVSTIEEVSADAHAGGVSAPKSVTRQGHTLTPIHHAGGADVHQGVSHAVQHSEHKSITFTHISNCQYVQYSFLS
jgi:hypothetical protein